jgi:hypothetical protein
MEMNNLTPLHAAQSKFAIAAFLGDKVMFEQAIIQYAIATGTKVKHDNSLRFSFDCISHERGSSGSGG